jgi:adenine-specific DNA-methyltransferase
MFKSRYSRSTHQDTVNQQQTIKAVASTQSRTNLPLFKRPELKPQSTTLWQYSSQHYGSGFQGSPRYQGATPSFVIWNLLHRYTKEGDLVLDPMCGSGTTLDVASDLNRKGMGFDLNPTRADIQKADARQLPVNDESVDFFFVDPPYSDHIHYSDDPRCIGKISAKSEAFFESLDQVFAQAFRVLKNQSYIGVYVCDFYSKTDGFIPVGTRCLALLLQYFKPIDHICVVRNHSDLEKGQYHKAALEQNFFLRGFNHLIVMQKNVVLPKERKAVSSEANVIVRKRVVSKIR